MRRPPEQSLCRERLGFHFLVTSPHTGPMQFGPEWASNTNCAIDREHILLLLMRDRQGKCCCLSETIMNWTVNFLCLKNSSIRLYSLHTMLMTGLRKTGNHTNELHEESITYPGTIYFHVPGLEPPIFSRLASSRAMGGLTGLDCGDGGVPEECARQVRH